MTISVVLRLTLPALREGRLAGHAEIVADGTRLVIHDADELDEAVLRHAEVARPASPDEADEPGVLGPDSSEPAGAKPTDQRQGRQCSDR